MELLQNLLSFFTEKAGLDKLTPLINAVKNGNFDLKSILNSIRLEDIAPILNSFFSNNKTPSKADGERLAPILEFADVEIVYSLNKYFDLSVC